MSKSAVNFRTTWILLGSAALLLVVLALYVFLGDDQKSNADGYLFANFRALNTKSNDINGLEIDKGGEKIVLSRQPDGRWRITKPVEARADSDRVEAIVGQLLGIRRDDKSADITPNPANHGLESPAAKITLFKGDRSESLSLGKTTIGADQAVIYVLSSDEPKTPHATLKSRLKFLLKEKPPEDAGTADMLIGFDELRTKKLLGEGMSLETAPNQILSIKLTETLPKGERTVMLSQKGDNIWHFEALPTFGDVERDVPPDKRNLSQIFDLSSLLNNVLSISVPDAKDFLANARDLSALGLDPTSEGVIRVDIERKDAIGTETMWISLKETPAEKGVPRDKAFVRYGGDATVAQVNATIPRMLKSFIADPSALRDRTLLKLRRDRIDAIDVTIDKRTFELRKINNAWQVAEGGKKNAANGGEIDALLMRLTQPREAKGFPVADATDASLGLGSPAVELNLWENGLTQPAKEDANVWPKPPETPAARLVFGKKDLGGIVYVRRYVGLRHADYKMPDDLLALASRSRLDYVDISLASFDPEKVEKVSFLKDAEMWEIERDKSPLPADAAEWIIRAPASQNGKLGNAKQIKLILDSFKALKPERVISEKATADQLATMGLDPAKPVFRLTLNFKDQQAENVYYFGNQVASKLSVYTKTSMSDYVFESPLARVELVTKGPLLDPYLYKIDAGDVKGIKLRGWADKDLQPKTLELERKPGGVWSARGDVKVDGFRVEEFFQAIAHPQSKERVAEKTGAKPEHGLDVAKGALEVEIDMGKDKSILLTLGGPVGKGSKDIYVSTSRAPGDVFTLDGEQLLPIIEKQKELLAK